MSILAFLFATWFPMGVTSEFTLCSKGKTIPQGLTLGFIVNKSSVFTVDNRLSMSAAVTGGVGPEFRSTDVAPVV